MIKENLVVTSEDFKEAFRKVKPSAMREVAIDVPKVQISQFSRSAVVIKKRLD